MYDTVQFGHQWLIWSDPDLPLPWKVKPYPTRNDMDMHKLSHIQLVVITDLPLPWKVKPYPTRNDTDMYGLCHIQLVMALCNEVQ